MAKNAEFNSWLSGVSKRSRKKKDVGEGKNFKREGKVSGASASNDSFVNFGGGAKKAAESHDKEVERNYMKRMVNEKKEIMRDPEKKKEQQKKNTQALTWIAGELAHAKFGNRPIYREDVMDFAQDYIPLDDKLGKVSRKVMNQQIARKRLAK